MRIAVIPARGGSKRILRKNIKEFIGKPVISYSIEAAIQSKLFDHVIVSTDDIEIAQFAKKLGAEVPFIRPEEISDDFSIFNPLSSSSRIPVVSLGLSCSGMKMLSRLQTFY
jgi:N-acylneuraminate cytidylyltransferase